MIYQNFKYIPQVLPMSTKGTRSMIKLLDTGEYLIRPDYRGKKCIVFTNGFDLHVYGQDNKILRDVSSDINFTSLAPFRKWCVYSGHYLSKHENVKSMSNQDRFIITDVLVLNNHHLKGFSFADRLTQIHEIFGFNKFFNGVNLKYCYSTNIDGVFIGRNFTKDLDFILPEFNRFIMTNKNIPLPGIGFKIPKEQICIKKSFFTF